MNIENYILDAIELVSAWDLPEDKLADTVNDQAMLMAGVNPDDIRKYPQETR